MPVIFYDNWLTFRVTGKKFELKGDLLKLITNKNYNLDLASISEKSFCMILQKRCILI